ncbi:uncharacterized protein LOC122887353 isoform X1 [Siniperca chuatsi]|uniref:uncharacterized protein LOC122887353 isoform X1 n=1 Tax=Siniperca chuatsi TaxID=119488 RepID=UPI001CE1CC13|nr:uncharacterized protein LOC122887353 isoform X1 [Siniperca chuatsi]
MFPGWVWQIKTSFSPIHLWKSTSCYPHSWTSPLSLSADCCSVGTADEKKQGRSVCIREEDRAESVAIKDGRISRLLLITGTPDHHQHHQPPQLSTGLIHTSSARSSSYSNLCAAGDHFPVPRPSDSSLSLSVSSPDQPSLQPRQPVQNPLPWSPLNAPLSSLRPVRSNSPCYNALRQTRRDLLIFPHNKTVQTLISSVRVSCFWVPSSFHITPIQDLNIISTLEGFTGNYT